MFNKVFSKKIEFWSSIGDLEKIAPIRPAKEFIPNWFKDTPRFVEGSEVENDNLVGNGSGTVKLCPSFISYFSTGYVIPMWADVHITGGYGADDIKINYSPKNKRVFMTKNFIGGISVGVHTDSQYIDHLPTSARKNNLGIVKLESPWFIKTPPGYSCLQLPMYYHFNEYFETLPGEQWTDVLYDTNVQITIKKPGPFLIERGTPLCMIVPFKRDQFYLKQVKSESKINKLMFSFNNISTKFNGGYRRLIKDHSTKCPFAKYT